MSTKKGRRLDKDRVTLRKGESQRADGIYDYRWSTPDGKRHAIYASTLEALREKEEQIIIDKRDGIKTEIRLVTVNGGNLQYFFVSHSVVKTLNIRFFD